MSRGLLLLTGLLGLLAPSAHAQDAVGSDTVGSDAVGSDTVGSDTVGSDAVGSDAVGSDAVGSDTVGSDAGGSNAGDGTTAEGPPEAFRELVLEAIAEYDRGLYPEALVAFERALAVRDSARVYRGIGMTLFELRRYAEAVDALDRALASEVDALTDAMRADIERLRERASRNVGTVVLRVTPPGAEVRVDGRAVAAEGSVTLDAGVHEIVASAPEHRTERRTVQVEGGGTERLELTLASSAPAERVVVVETPATAPTPPRDDTPWIVAGVALGGVGVGGLIGGLAWLANRDAAVEACAQAIERGAECANGAAIVTQRDLAGVTVGLAGAALVGGAIVLIVGATDAQESAPPVACAPTLDGFHCAAELAW